MSRPNHGHGRAPVCLLGADVLFDEATAEAFAARHDHLEVRRVRYSEPSELRRARGTGAVAPKVAALAPPLSAEDRAALRDAVALLALDLPDRIAELAPELRLVQAYGAGVEWLLVHDLERHGIQLTNARGIAAPSIAEFVMARLLQVWKDLPRIDAQQRDHLWRPRWATEVAGRTLGVVSLGAIGRATASRAKAFGMRVVATRRSAGPGAQDPDADELWPTDLLDEVLGRCDAVLVSAPATQETADLFDAARFAAMKPGAVFVNVSRGSLVDEPALVDALESGHLGAAVIDVTKEEPTPPDHPFWDAPNLLLSPHCSTSFDHYSERLLDLFAENVGRLGDGQPLVNVVDRDRGY